MMAIGLDLYNQMLTGDVAMTLQAARVDPEHIPCVIVRKDGSDWNDSGSSDSEDYER